jgi:hypothetical protein
MLRQLGRIERLVKELSELNRIESGELVLERPCGEHEAGQVVLALGHGVRVHGSDGRFEKHPARRPEFSSVERSRGRRS